MVEPSHQVWVRPLLLFVLTLLSVFVTGAIGDPSITEANPASAVLAAMHSADAMRRGVVFAASLLSILLAHEFGHYIAARIHRVPVSLPHFIPVPLLSPFGTMGAVIRMGDRIKSANALLDIGAAGPLSGLMIAIPLYLWGLQHSTLVMLGGEHMFSLGNSLLLTVLDRFGPHAPPGMDVLLSPTAFAAWAGMFVTMINLIPVGQLDGGHVAYALLGPRQNRYARWMHRATLVFALVRFVWLAAMDHSPERWGLAMRGSMFWLVWFQMLSLLSSVGDADAGISTRMRGVMVIGLLGCGSFTEGWKLAIPAVYTIVLIVLEWRFGVLRPHTLFTHPETEAQTLSPLRRGIAWLTLAFFVLLFMPTPMFV